MKELKTNDGINVPLMGGSRMDYVNGSYAVDVTRGQDKQSMMVFHSVSGENLVRDLLSKGHAAFAVEVSSPYATYRKVERCLNQGRVTAEGAIVAEQEVVWLDKDVVPPVYIRPLVIANIDSAEKILLTQEHGLHDLWNGTNINLLPGTVLAVDTFWTPTSTFESLLRVTKDQQLEPGSFRVEKCTLEGFHFKVHMHPSLYDFVANPLESQINYRDSILTGALAIGFEILRREYDSPEKWKEFPVLRQLHAELKEKNIVPWDEGADFHGEEVATRLKPIEFEGASDDD